MASKSNSKILNKDTMDILKYLEECLINYPKADEVSYLNVMDALATLIGTSAYIAAEGQLHAVRDIADRYKSKIIDAAVHVNRTAQGVVNDR